MTTERSITSTAALAGRDRREADAIVDLCRAEGLSLKLDLSVRDEHEGEIGAVVCHEGGALVGFCALDHGHDLELCGAVHPDHRRRGVGRALLSAALVEARRLARPRVLVICEERSQGGLALLRTAGSERAFGEHGMDLAALIRGTRRGPELTIERATLTDAADLAHVIAVAMDDKEDDALVEVVRALDEPGRRYYLGRLDGEVVTGLKVVFGREKAFVYGFGVLPERRRLGVGRRFLEGVVDAIAAEGHPRVALEVETQNVPAVSLYRSMGFTITTTYEYHAIAIEQPSAPAA